MPTAALERFFLTPYRPRQCLTQWQYFSNFLRWISLAQVIRSINWQSDTMLLGRITSTHQPGLFTTARTLSYIPLFAILVPTSRPLPASLASLKNDPDRMRRAYQLTSVAAITIGLPALVGESLLAPPDPGLALNLIPGLFALPLGPMTVGLERLESGAKLLLI